MEKTQNPESGAGYLERTYQRSLCLLYLKAVRDVLGESVEVTIFNSLSRGLYTEIETERPPTDVQLRRIEARMRSYVEADAPITRKEFGRMALLGYLRQGGGASPERIALLENAPDLHYVAVCELDGYENIFYGPLFPSAGPLRLFELLRYMDGVMLRYPHPSDPSRLPDMLEDYKLYSAFREGWTIAELCGLRFVGDLNREIEAGNAQEVIALSERLHRAKTGLIAKRVVARKRRVVLIAGPSSSGKTTFAKRLAARLGELGQAPLYLGTDDYFLERAQSPVGPDGKPDYEGVSAIDTPLFNQNISALLRGEEVDLPTFDFLSGTKQYGSRITRLAEGQPIVIEGLHSLNPLLSEHLPKEEIFRVYISPLTQLGLDDHNRIPTTDIRLIRRILRDVRTRGHAVERTIEDWQKVRQGEHVYVFPYCGEADMVFNSALLYELPILKRHAEAALAAIPEGSPAHADAVRLLDFLAFYRLMDEKNEAAIPGDSILREFIG